MTSSKAIAPYTPTPAELDAVLGDVYYEIQQLFKASKYLLANANSASPAFNAFLESALLHVRVLLHFFEASKRGDTRQKPPSENDDVLSIDFKFDAKPIPVDPEYRDRLNKYLAHLTYSRAKQPCDWPHQKVIYPVLCRAIEFIESLGPEVRGRTKVTSAEWGALLDDLKTYKVEYDDRDI